MNIITKSPTDELSGFANASYGNGGAINLSGGVSGPLAGDNVQFRLSGVYVTDDGRIENSFANEEQDFIDHDYTIRGRITAQPTENLCLDFRVFYRDFRTGSQF